jgi:uncharacterized membrane protein YccC
MATSNPSLHPASSTAFQPFRFWSRESSSLKQGIKTGLAGAITYAIYVGWNLPQGYWAVFTALVVTQVNLGASWRAAMYRTVGSTCGAVAAALLMLVLGTGPLRAGIALFLLATLFGYLTALHPSFSAAGFTTAIILVFGSLQEPWHMAWLRVLYTILGAVVAFLVGALIWPVRARDVLRERLANILSGAGELYRAVTKAALAGVRNEEEIQLLDRRLHDLRRGITQQMEEAKSELTFSRFNESEYQEFINLADQVRRRLTAMAEDSSLYAHAEVQPELVPSLPRLAETTARSFSVLAGAIRTRGKQLNPTDLEAAICELEVDLSRLRKQGATVPFALDRMLPFWSLVFNLREIAQDLKQLESTLVQLT